MPLEPYSYQPAGSKHSTPSPVISQGHHGRRTSSSSLWSSPESVDTRATTPNPSPFKGLGRDILPRIRPCDQTLESEIDLTSYDHLDQFLEYDPDFSVELSRPGYERAWTCPPETESLATTVSAASNIDSWAFSTFESPQLYAPVARGGTVGHGRSTSASAIDPTTLRRHAFPYRTVPQYITQAQPNQYNAPTIQPQAIDFVSNPFDFPTNFPSHPLARELTPELVVETGDEPTTNLMSYLTTPNPTVHLISKSGNPSPLKSFWWDIRQLRPWSDFNTQSLMNIPYLPNILHINVNETGLPTPNASTINTSPGKVSDLHTTIANHYATKVNAALTTTGRHAYIESTSSALDGPYFLTRCVDDTNTIPTRRGRVVGLVKPYEEWNTGMKHGGPNDQVEYLRPLAQIQRLMREQECRYGFLISEIELICVRMPNQDTLIPDYGTLEISRSIPVSRHGSSDGLTVCMALWFLCMLTSDEPLAGHLHWWVDIGAPAAHTRAKCCDDEERVDWIRKIRGPTGQEMRKAKQARGWIWPRDEYKPKMEGGRPRSRKAS